MHAYSGLHGYLFFVQIQSCTLFRVCTLIMAKKQHVWATLGLRIYIFWKVWNTCMFNKELFQPIRLFFFESLSSCTVIEDCTVITYKRDPNPYYHIVKASLCVDHSWICKSMISCDYNLCYIPSLQVLGLFSYKRKSWEIKESGHPCDEKPTQQIASL